MASLTPAGAPFAEAASGLEAIEQLALGPVALMVLDLNMPDMHGLEVLKFVRSHPGLPPTAGASCSPPAATKPAATAAMAAGATLYLTKPFVAAGAGRARARAARSTARHLRAEGTMRVDLSRREFCRRLHRRLLRRVRGAPDATIRRLLLELEPASAGRRLSPHARGAVPELPFDQGHLRDGGTARRRDAGAPHGELPARAARARHRGDRRRPRCADRRRSTARAGHRRAPEARPAPPSIDGRGRCLSSAMRMPRRLVSRAAAARAVQAAHGGSGASVFTPSVWPRSRAASTSTRPRPPARGAGTIVHATPQVAADGIDPFEFLRRRT